MYASGWWSLLPFSNAFMYMCNFKNKIKTIIFSCNECCLCFSIFKSCFFLLFVVKIVMRSERMVRKKILSTTRTHIDTNRELGVFHCYAYHIEFSLYYFFVKVFRTFWSVLLLLLLLCVLCMCVLYAYVCNIIFYFT